MISSQKADKRKVQQLQKDLDQEQKIINGILEIVKNPQAPSVREEIAQTGTSKSIQFCCFLFYNFFSLLCLFPYISF